MCLCSWGGGGGGGRHAQQSMKLRGGGGGVVVAGREFLTRLLHQLGETRGAALPCGLPCHCLSCRRPQHCHSRYRRRRRRPSFWHPLRASPSRPIASVQGRLISGAQAAEGACISRSKSQ